MKKISEKVQIALNLDFILIIYRFLATLVYKPRRKVDLTRIVDFMWVTFLGNFFREHVNETNVYLISFMVCVVACHSQQKRDAVFIFVSVDNAYKSCTIKKLLIY